MKIIVITGPTGVGKTRLSLALAKKFDGEIISADALQLYSGLDIGTAKVTKEEQANIKHHLLDIKTVYDDFSVYDYQQAARKAIADIQDRGKTVIMVGGTGLYIKAALYDYCFSKEDSKQSYDKLSNEELYQKLLLLDPNIKIDANNRRRLIRALIYYDNHHTSINSNNNGDHLLYDSLFIGLTTKRDRLYDLINKRVDKMVDHGLIEEVKQYYDQNLRTHALMTGIGYKEIYQYLDGELTKKEAIDLIKKNSRHYAKRQYTFFNNKMTIKWFNVDFENFDNTIMDVTEYIKTNL